ncbi:LysR family transcriptional regulator [Thalassotalea mangrovi]|uniref:LysR family transcriptional regulator n=1 Tax=Thalassotalea mangrovi TaxID=2572245 RepID=A0A4U1B4V1_9GAMM|nr:LysR family transcriptional regulator [Thalassotalea mangrovi]TKB45317.1 LysR family transcriptional regulator [Thalassotalea mangrovi]
MKIELLSTFLEVSHTLHVRVAAENLFLTQAAVSARIKQLEEDLGVQLFDRSQKRLKLTPEGHRLTRHAKEMLTLWQKIKLDVGIAQDNSIQLFVGSITSIWDVVLQDWLQKIHRNLDDVCLHTSTYSSLELRKQIQTRLLDIAFLFEPTYSEDVITEKVATVPLQLVSTTDNLSVSDIENFISVDYGESVNSQFRRHFNELITPRHHMSQPRVALNFILDAGGSAYLPRQLCFEYIRKKKLFLVDSTPVFEREIFAVYLAQNQKLATIEDALQIFPHIRS